MRQLPDQTVMKPRKSARQARSAATIEVIVEAAARILETAGPSGYTTNAVAECAGVSVGSRYQYFPNKDAITRALIRRELKILATKINDIDPLIEDPDPLTRFLTVAVGQQLDRPDLAQLLEMEEERLVAGVDIDPVREHVMARLSEILRTVGHPEERLILDDVMRLTATLINAPAGRGERDRKQIVSRAEAVVRARVECL